MGEIYGSNPCTKRIKNGHGEGAWEVGAQQKHHQSAWDILKGFLEHQVCDSDLRNKYHQGSPPGTTLGTCPVSARVQSRNPHAQRSLEGYSPRGHKESDMTEWLSKELFMKNHLIRKIKYLAQCCPAKKEKAKIRTEVYLTLYPWTLHPLKVPKPQNR